MHILVFNKENLVFVIVYKVIMLTVQEKCVKYTRCTQACISHRISIFFNMKYFSKSYVNTPTYDILT